jgi:hypothetical protein
LAINFITLTGAKTVPESIHNWVNYGKTPVSVILAMAEALIYSRLRVREMRASTVLSLPVEAWTLGLPTGYLEPISMVDRELGELIPHRFIEERGLLRRRTYDTDRVTTLNGAITAGATSMVVADRSVFQTTFPFTLRLDSEAVKVTAGASTTLTVVRGYGGTTAAAHANGATVDGMLDSGTPVHVAVFSNLFQFDCKADDARTYDLAFYETPTSLGATNLTNFLTTRYPNLIYQACLALAAQFRKDTEEMVAELALLDRFCADANAESDLGRAS